VKKNPTKKLLEKLDKTIPGSSNYLYDLARKGLTKNEKFIVDLGAHAILESEQKNKPKSKQRKQFSTRTKKWILEFQDNRCKLCGKKSKHWDFDHINGDSSNNTKENCQALCPNCHAKKTRNKNKLF